MVLALVSLLAACSKQVDSSEERETAEEVVVEEPVESVDQPAIVESSTEASFQAHEEETTETIESVESDEREANEPSQLEDSYTIILDAEKRRGHNLIKVRYDANQEGALLIHGDGAEIIENGNELTADISNNFHGEIVLGQQISSLTCRGGFRLILELPAVDTFELLLEGGVNGKVKLEAATTKLDIYGGAEINFVGTTDILDLHVEGGAHIYAKELVAKEVTVSMQGAGELLVHAQDSLKANLEGIGRIKYAGNPTVVERNVEGMGFIEPIH